jgi:DNA-directed RNA polymerase subunit beta'
VEKPKDPLHFSGIRISIASPEQIRKWSHGEVKKPETLNYRTFKPERDGLFCAKIFGPIKDYECNCGKYKRMKHRGIVCEKCGVEVIQSKVRRERMGHIELASPVAHIWFFKSTPSRIGAALDMTLRDLERILYFERYVVLDPGDSELKQRALLKEEEYLEIKGKHLGLKVGMGAEAIRELLKKVTLDEEIGGLRAEMLETKSVQKRKKIVKRLKVLMAFRESGNHPEWMILTIIPVLPPDLRPLVPLDGGRFATSDLNDLYRRVINRNNRLKRLLELNAPEVIIRNEKRMLQEAVDALFDNGRRGRVIRGTNRRPLKSLSDMLKGKQGRFRQNLLGKRVDYSGRSVIVVGPELKLHQCGLPKIMALELFKPFIYHKLEAHGLATTIKAAKKMVEKLHPKVWDILEEVIEEHPVMLNRAPTLHRLGIQAFEPVLVEGKAIRLHPLVCAAYNADFDGDQMAVHIPLSVEAQLEAKVLMMATQNILSPAHGKPVAVPSQDIVLGCYYLTKKRNGDVGEGKIFSSPDEVRQAYDGGALGLQAGITVRIDKQRVETTTGRLLLREILPREVPFDLANRDMNKKQLVELVDQVYRNKGLAATIKFLDDLKDLGFHNATRAGISIGINDMQVPVAKGRIVADAMSEVQKIEEQYQLGHLSRGEKHNKVVDVWTTTTDRVAEEMMKELAAPEAPGDGDSAQRGDFNPILMMADSGARGSAAQIRQLAGMRGLMAKPSGEIIETPITANFREGLSVLQYFVSTHGARKGLADTALKTANSGYLTRRLVDVANDTVIAMDDCGTLDGITVSHLLEGGEIVEHLKDRVLGRVTLEAITDPVTRKKIVPANHEIDEEMVDKIDEAGLDRVKIRSVLTCEAPYGLCRRCYGRDLARGRLVDLGEAVGIIAAQSIGEPGTQLTMRTFHIGGTASKVVEQSTQEARNAGKILYKDLKTAINSQGKRVVMNKDGAIAVVDKDGREKEKYPVVYGATVRVAEGEAVKPGAVLVEWNPYTTAILSEVTGKIKFGDIREGETLREVIDPITGHSQWLVMDFKDASLRPRISIKGTGSKTVGRYPLPVGANPLVKEGDEVVQGDVLAKISRDTSKTKDITGGLPRVVDLFEARKPKEEAIISEINGLVRLGPFVKNMRQVIIEGEASEVRKYLIPKGKHIIVRDGDYVRVGEPLMDGSINPHDILRVLGEKELQKYLVNEIQEVYRLQGVGINDKHIEVIVRQMLRRVQIEEVGDTRFLLGEQVDRFEFARENDKAAKSGGKSAKARPILQGITRASLTTDSFISAASFQETTRVLTEAAVAGKVDPLVGLKENVIIGRLIGAGTGLKQYRSFFMRKPGHEAGSPPELDMAKVEE